METKEEILKKHFDKKGITNEHIHVAAYLSVLDAMNEYATQQVNLLNKPAVSKCVEPVAMDTLIDHYATKLLSCYTKSGIIEQLKHLISKVN
jgi:hypothetical protein